MERYSAETVAMGGAGTPTIGATDLEGIGADLNEGPNEETHLARTRHDPYLPRLKYLRDEAVHDGYVLNPASEIDFPGLCSVCTRHSERQPGVDG